MENFFVVIEHEDDKYASHTIKEVFETHEEALDYVLNVYFNGDKEQMDFEQESDADYWDENCNGIQIVAKGDTLEF